MCTLFDNFVTDPFGIQGFTQLHFTPLEVLAIIEGVQKRLDKKFMAEEIERGVLKDVLIDDDYDLARVVSCPIKFPCKGYRVIMMFERDILNDPLNNANNVEKLGANAIKEQQRINLKFSSDQVAIIPEDRAQRMLAGVSRPVTFERDRFLSIYSFTFECNP